MSRIGKLPVEIADGIEVKQANGSLTVKGPKGELSLDVHPDMKVVVDEGRVRVERPSEQKEHRALHGLTRSLIAKQRKLRSGANAVFRDLRREVLSEEAAGSKNKIAAAPFS